MCIRDSGLDEQNIADKKTMSVNAMISLHMTPPKANEEVEIVTGKHIMEGEVEEVEDVVAIVSDNEEEVGTLPG